MRIWVDLTNSPHVLVMRPVIRALEARGHRVARHRARLRADARAARSGSASRTRRSAATAAAGSPRRASGLASRSLALARTGPRARRFDAALGHGSNDITVAAKLLGIPSATTFDYEWATAQHTVNCRLARRVVVPDAIPPERLAPLRRDRAQAAPVPGAQGGVLPRRLRARRRGARRARPRRARRRSRSCARRRPSRSTTASSTRCSRSCSSGCASRRRSSCSRARPSSAPSWPRPAATSSPSGRRRAVAVAFADLVVSAGGTMNREAVALGTPVWTTFEGRLGAVDERLIADGPAAPARRAPEEVEVRQARRRGRRRGDRARRGATRSCSRRPAASAD